MKQLCLPSFAKINLFLDVVGKRSDGFHNIETIFQTISLKDNLFFLLTNDRKNSLTSAHPNLPLDESNLILRAVSLMQARFAIQQSVIVHIEKSIPLAGGLAGGSSNAAITLLALNALWNLQLSRLELSKLALELGSDVPFFLWGGTAMASGRGEELSPLADSMQNLAFLLVNPGVESPTAPAYQQLQDTLCRSDRSEVLQSLWLAGERQRFFELTYNRLETTVLPRITAVQEVKEWLASFGLESLMSGSGATVFAPVDPDFQVPKQMKEQAQEKGWFFQRVSMVNHQNYRDALSTVYVEE